MTILADTARIADGAATAICNSVRGKDVETSVQKGLEFVNKVRSIVRGALIVRGEYVGSIGEIPQLINVTKGLDLSKVLLIEFARPECINNKLG